MQFSKIARLSSDRESRAAINFLSALRKDHPQSRLAVIRDTVDTYVCRKPQKQTLRSFESTKLAIAKQNKAAHLLETAAQHTARVKLICQGVKDTSRHKQIGAIYKDLVRHRVHVNHLLDALYQHQDHAAAFIIYATELLRCLMEYGFKLKELSEYLNKPQSLCGGRKDLGWNWRQLAWLYAFLQPQATALPYPIMHLPTCIEEIFAFVGVSKENIVLEIKLGAKAAANDICTGEGCKSSYHDIHMKGAVPVVLDFNSLPDGFAAIPPSVFHGASSSSPSQTGTSPSSLANSAQPNSSPSASQDIEMEGVDDFCSYNGFDSNTDAASSQIPPQASPQSSTGSSNSKWPSGRSPPWGSGSSSSLRSSGTTQTSTSSFGQASGSTTSPSSSAFRQPTLTSPTTNSSGLASTKPAVSSPLASTAGPSSSSSATAPFSGNYSSRNSTGYSIPANAPSQNPPKSSSQPKASHFSDLTSSTARPGTFITREIPDGAPSQGSSSDKGKGKARATDDAEDETTLGPLQGSASYKGKGKARATDDAEDESTTDPSSDVLEFNFY